MGTVTQAIIIENSSATLMARVAKQDGTLLVQAEVDSITAKVFDAKSQQQIGGTLTLSADECIYDTLQKPPSFPAWTADSIGANFVAEISGDYFPQGNRTYRVEVKVSPVDGYPFYLLFDLYTTDILSE